MIAGHPKDPSSNSNCLVSGPKQASYRLGNTYSTLFGAGIVGAQTHSSACWPAHTCMLWGSKGIGKLVFECLHILLHDIWNFEGDNNIFLHVSSSQCRAFFTWDSNLLGLNKHYATFNEYRTSSRSCELWIFGVHITKSHIVAGSLRVRGSQMVPPQREPGDLFACPQEKMRALPKAFWQSKGGQKCHLDNPELLFFFSGKKRM